MAKKKYSPAKKQLRELYHKQQLSTFKIAKIFHCTAGTIINRMKEYGIKRRHSGPRRIRLSRRALHKLYVQKRLSSWKIAKICHCHQTPVLNRLRKYNIPVRQPKQKVVISKEELKKLYVGQRLSAYKIAKLFHCTSGTIYRNLKTYNIKTRPLKQVPITKNQLRDLYTNKNLSLSRIAHIYNCSPTVVLDRMKKYQIARKTISEASTVHSKTDLTEI